MDGALAVLAGTDTTKAEPHQARWAYAEWTDLVKRRKPYLDAGHIGVAASLCVVNPPGP